MLASGLPDPIRMLLGSELRKFKDVLQGFQNILQEKDNVNLNLEGFSQSMLQGYSPFVMCNMFSSLHLQPALLISLVMTEFSGARLTHPWAKKNFPAQHQESQ
jgi:hypothetical protein